MRFFKRLSDDEITMLHISCYLHDDYPITLAYDDEVMNVLFRRKDRMQLLKIADTMIFRNLPDDIIQESYEKHFKNPGEGISIEAKREQIIEKVTKRYS